MNALRTTLGTRELGKLYDRPVLLSASNSILLAHVVQVDDNKVFRGAEPFQFSPLSQVEHKVRAFCLCLFPYLLLAQLYQRYCDLPMQARLEQLPSSFGGQRFIQAMMYGVPVYSCRVVLTRVCCYSEYHQARQQALAPGVYIGYLYTLNSVLGIFLESDC